MSRYDLAMAITVGVLGLPDKPTLEDALRFGHVLFSVLEILEEAGR